jgi:peptidoglycan/LPS O-acetylase OafA/YrhL
MTKDSYSALGNASTARVRSGSLRDATMNRMPFLDFLRAVASQLIVLHHMAFYGPLSDYAQPLAPYLIDWFSQYARLAVQAFLVMGGFFAARSLGRCKPLDLRVLGRMVWARYRRIGFPYLGALAVAIAANALASQWMDHESISAPPTLGQLIAHAFFLHSILGYPALTAGIWYLAIDFQLFLLCLLVVWAGQVLKRRVALLGQYSPIGIATAMLSPIALLSLFWFNRHAEYDNWAVYFVAAHFAGFLLNEVLEGRRWVGWGFAYWGVVVLGPLPSSSTPRRAPRCSTSGPTIARSATWARFPTVSFSSTSRSYSWSTPGAQRAGILLFQPRSGWDLVMRFA